LWLSPLEDRAVPAAYTVTALTDTGAGSGTVGDLRYCLTQANASAGVADTIDLTGVSGTITLTGELPVTDAVAITGPGADRLTINGNGAGRVFDVTGADVTLAGLTVAGGSVAGSGGGVLVQAGGTLFLTDALVSGNTATGASGNGGGIAFTAGGSLVVRNSAVVGNTAGGSGGGIDFAGVASASPPAGFTPGTLVVINSTVANNTATGPGGGVSLQSFDDALLVQDATIAGNAATAGGGIARTGGSAGASTVTLQNTIVSGNTASAAPDLQTDGTATATYSAIGTSAGYTLSVASGNNIGPGASLQLGPLQNNGGPTPTMAPASGSLLVNAGTTADEFPAGLTTDQRGGTFTRVTGPRVDIGAVEFHPNAPPSVTTSSGATTYTENAAATPIDPGLTVADVDGSTLSGAVVTVTAGLTGQDVLAFGPLPGGVTATTGVGSVTFSGTATVAAYQTLLRSVAFSNTSDNPAAGERAVAFTVTDAPSSGPPLTSPAATRTVTVVPVDDAPTVAGPAGPFVAATAAAFPLTGANAITVADVDAGANPVRVTLTVTAGTLAATPSGAAVVLGGGTTLLTVTGPAADVNATLAALTTTTPADPATVTLTAAVSDLGNSGTGGPLTASLPPITLTVIHPPAVADIALPGPTGTTAGLVKFTVTFSVPVVGVDPTDFRLTTSGITGAGVVSVSPTSGPAAAYTVSVSTGTGTGTIRLDVVDDDSVTGSGVPLGGAGVGNGGFTAGPSYTLDRTDPTLVSITRADPDPTTAATVRYTVVFSEPVTGVDAGDFQVTTTGLTAAGGITRVAGSGTTWAVTASTGIGSGTLTLRLVDNDTIVDAVGHPLAGNGSVAGPAYTVDRTGPTVASVTLADQNPIGPGLARFTVTFSEPVTGVDASDFGVTVVGLDGAKVVGVTGTGATYTVTAATGFGHGRLRLDVSDDGSITDGVGNALGGAFTGGPSYTVTPAAPGTDPRRPARVVAGTDGGAPLVTVYDADGVALASFLAYDPSFTGGVHVALGDLNADGVDDIITGPGPGGGPHVKVIDGTKLGDVFPNGEIADSALLYTFQAYLEDFRGGVYVAAGDINGDGRPDVVTGAGVGGGPAITVFSGRDGSLMYTLMAYEDSFRGGVTVAVGDVNGDGRDDLIAGSGPGGGPSVAVFDGTTRNLLGTFFAYDPNFRGGVNVTAADTNGDGVAEIITGPGLDGGAVVGVFEGAKGVPVTVLNGAGRLGIKMNGLRVAAADLNGDGRADLLVVGGPGSVPATVRAYDSAGVKELGVEFALDQDYLGGVFVGGNG
jgi:hypothetical protein